MHEPRDEVLRLELIDEPAHQLRQSIDPERLGELADSIAAEGLHQPLGVRGPTAAGRYEIVWGHRRLLAMRLLQLESTRARVFPHDYDPLLAAVSENLNREQLNPMEEARAVARFVERGQPDSAIARLFRRSLQWVRERRELLALAPDLQAAIEGGVLPMSVARVLADVDHGDYRAELIREAQRTGASAATAEVWRAHYLSDRERIIVNRLAVADIAARREAWKLYVPCELCGEDTIYEETRSLRVCNPCVTELLRLVQEAATAAGAPRGPSAGS